MLGTIRIEEFRDVDAILSLSHEWEDFQGRAEQSVPFLQPDYVALWSRILGKGSSPRVLAAWSDRDLVGYAPFMITARPLGPFSVATLEFIGNNIGYPGDILYADVVSSRPQRQVVSALLSQAKARWKVASWDFGYLHPGSPTTGVIREILKLRDDAAFPGSQSYISLELPSDWDSFFANLSLNTRRNYRRRLRKLGGIGDVQFCVSSDPRAASQRVAELIRNHERWWSGTSRKGWFGDEPVQRFLISAAELLASQGRYLAFALKLDGVPIAWNVGAFDGHRYFEQMVSYDRTCASCSPGILLSIFLLRHLLSIEVRRVELGPGLDERKQSLGGKPTAFRRIQGHLGWLRGIARLRQSRTGRLASA